MLSGAGLVDPSGLLQQVEVAGEVESEFHIHVRKITMSLYV